MVRALATALTIAALGALAPAASADRWASPTSTDSTGACATALTPCRLDHAVNNAPANSKVIVQPGAYSVTTPLTVTAAITIEGVAGEARPQLTGSATLGAPVLDVRAPTFVRHLEIEAQDAVHPPVHADGAVLENLVLRSAGAPTRLAGDPGTTVLRDSLALSSGTGATDGAVRLITGTGASADVAVINVTAYAKNGSAVGIRCEQTSGQGLLYNTIARGGASDVNGSCGGARVNAKTYTGLTATNIQTSEPLFDGEYRPLAGSPTIDAGRNVQGIGSKDLAGRNRVLGTYPDIGAHESQRPADPPKTDPPASTPAPNDDAPKTDPANPRGDTSEPLTPADPPKLGKTIVLDLKNGTIKIKLPGAAGFISLLDAKNLPVGTVIDATKGEVTLQTGLPGGRFQSGTFKGGQFEVRQPRTAGGMTDILLRGGAFAGCPRGKAKARAASGRKKKRTSTVRRLWASDRGGKFRTHGKESVATVRGTKWLTEDRCDGTLTRVTEGAVDVKDRRTGKVKRVRAGRSLLVRSR